ncbi:unnamed protein product [Camellia sinensis]
MASEEIGLVPPQRLDNGLNPQLVFQDEALRFSCGAPPRRAGDPGPKTRELTGFIDDRYFQPQAPVEFRRSNYVEDHHHQDSRNWNGRTLNSPSGDESEGDDEEDDDDDDEEEEEEDDEGDGEVARLVGGVEGCNNKNNNSNNTSERSNSDAIGNGKSKHLSSFVGSNRGILMKEGNVLQSGNDNSNTRVNQNDNHGQRRVNQYQNMVTVADPDGDLYYSQYLQGGEGSGSGQKDVEVENGCVFSGRKEGLYSSESGESLRMILSDPLTGALMDDAVILPCGHSFGGGGIQHVIRMFCGKPSCGDLRISADGLLHLFSTNIRRLNFTKSLRRKELVVQGLHKRVHVQVGKIRFLCRSYSLEAGCSNHENRSRTTTSLRATVQAFRREEELQVYRSSKRRRERFEQDKGSYGDSTPLDHPRGRGVQFPFVVTDRVIIKGNKRTPQRFVGREAIVTTQCLNGWYVVKTLDNAESVKLQYRSLAKVSDNLSSKPAALSKITPNWL